MNSFTTKARLAFGIVLFAMASLVALGFGLLTVGLAILIGTLFGVAARLGSTDRRHEFVDVCEGAVIEGDIVAN